MANSELKVKVDMLARKVAEQDKQIKEL